MIEQQFFGDSPTGHDELYPHHHHHHHHHQQPNDPNARATDFSVSQNNYSMSDGGIMNQSIFSADFNRAPRQKTFQVEQAGHHSVDLNTGLVSREMPNSSSHEEYFPLMQQDDQVTSKTWQPASNLSNKLDMRGHVGGFSKPSPVQIPQNAHHQGSFHEEVK